MFKRNNIYIKIRRNHVEVTDLESGKTVSKNALTPFSSMRNIVSNFNHAHETIRAALKEVGLRKSFFRLAILMHQLEGLEGGLSEIEKRALRDLAEMAGANKIQIVEQEAPLSPALALAKLKEDK